MQEIADMFNISSLYMQKNFKNVLKFLIDEMSPQVIKFPTTISEKEAIANEFKEVSYSCDIFIYILLKTFHF